ncbi:MAG: ribosome-associated translation inhibitor RaiA [Pseudomonadota bacterium]
MQTSVTFKNVDTSEHLKGYVQDKLDRLDKFLDNPAEANVVLRVEKFRHIAEVNINGDRLNVIGKEETDDMYSAIDLVLDKLEKQIKKNKQKIRDHRSGGKNRDKIGPLIETMLQEEDSSEQIRVKNIDYKPMDIDEAVMQMGLVEDSFLVFTNSRTEKVNVLYRMNDGNFGLIQPSN